MIISMQGNWTVSVKQKKASYDQQFVIMGADTQNGPHTGTVGTSVYVTGTQWSIAVKNNPGSGFQLSDTQIKFPKMVGGNYVFEIWTNDAWVGDKDFNDLILECSCPVNINDFIVYGNVSLYSGFCLLNPCWKWPWVIETYEGLQAAIKNPLIRSIIEKEYPERIKEDIFDPKLPDPPHFKPIIIDPTGEATIPNTELIYSRLETKSAKSKSEEPLGEYYYKNYELLDTNIKRAYQPDAYAFNQPELIKTLEGLVLNCDVGPAVNSTLTFEEYDRTAAEMAGGAYTGEGDRRLLGDTITDMNGNYIFRFSFGMEIIPGFEDSTDFAPGENINKVLYPDVIVKLTAYSPHNVLYESAPYYNIPNLKRIDLCLPESVLQPTSTCFNGNLIGSLGNVFIGGNQNNIEPLDSVAHLQRYGYSNSLEADGKISVDSSLAGFNVDCACWYGTIDMKGCMYDLAIPATQNEILNYTIRIKKEGTSNWNFVSQNYKHPRYSKRHIPNYIGDDVGPTTLSLNVDGSGPQDVPAYLNIQRDLFYNGVDWEFTHIDRYMRLNTLLYDKDGGIRQPGTYYVRVDGYNSAGNIVATDMIALFIDNNPLEFELTSPAFTDPAVLYSGCGLYRLTDAQLNTPIQFSFKAKDNNGFVDSYTLSSSRCPSPMIGLLINQPAPPHTPVSTAVIYEGDATANVPHACNGYTGTKSDFSNNDLVLVELQPDLVAGGWIKAGEYFTKYTFTLHAQKRMTNGYNHGLSDDYWKHTHIYMERVNP